MPVDLSELSLAERRELHAQLAYEFRGSKAGVSELPNELWDTINDVLRADGKHRQPLGRFIENFGKARYTVCSEQMDALIKRAVPVHTRKPVVMAVRRLMLECLRDHLGSRNIPATPTSLLNSFGMLKYSVDQAFPGYIEAQLLHQTAKAFQAA